MASRFTSNVQRWVVIAVVVLVFGAYMTAYQVRFTETAVVSTFGRADASSVHTEPGLRFKIPYIQTETKYDRRSRFIAGKPVQLQTKDEKQVIVNAFMTWSVKDPLKFYQRYSGRGSRAEDHYTAAERDLQELLLAALNTQITRFRLDELLAAEQGKSKLSEVESSMLDILKSPAAGRIPLSEFGIESSAVGISGMRFAAEPTKKVFDAMIANRAKLANATITSGTTAADTIRKKADADAKRITQFAERLASSIRSKGLEEAAQYYKQMGDEPDLAIFLKNMDMIRETISRQTTLVLPTSMPGLGLIRPDALKSLKPGQIPAVDPDKATDAAKPSQGGTR